MIDFIYKLQSQGVMIWAEGELIKVRILDGGALSEVDSRRIRREKQQLIRLLTEYKIFGPYPTFILPHHKGVDDIPLSFSQERLWFIEQYEQSTNAYHIPIGLQLSELVNEDIFRWSLQAIVRRHEILRTIFSQNQDGTDCQVVLDDPLSFSLYEFDSNKKWKAQLHEDINTPFDLRKEYPIRVVFYRLSNADPKIKCYVLINIHHVAFDGWSTDVFLRELITYYESRIESRLPDLLDLSIQYKDFSIWQRQYLTGNILEKQMQYWKRKLQSFEILDFPTDKSRPQKIDYHGGRVGFKLDFSLSENLKSLAKEQNCTLYTVLLSGFYILLHKYTGQSNLIVGAPAANRNYVQLENLIGFFVNSLAIRVDVISEQTGINLIEQVHETLIEGQCYQDLPFEKLVDLLKVEQDQSRHPIFQVMFGMQNFVSAMTSKYFEPIDIAELYQTAKFDLELFLTNKEDGIVGCFNYAIALFKEETISRLIVHYQVILEQLVEEPRKPIRDYHILTEKERQKILYDWSNADKTYSKDKTIYQLFQEQVDKTPDEVALVFEKEKLTYRTLNEKSNQLARYIRKQYKKNMKKVLQPDTLIALCLDRGLDMIIGILGTLKAGGAYVPIDPLYPRKRIKYILDDTRSSILLTQTHLKNKLWSILNDQEKNQNRANKENSKVCSQSQLVTLDNKPYKEELASNLAQHSNPTDLAYVIYTSGTTGVPKGVLQLHANVMRLFTATDENFKFNRSDIWTLYHSYVFDFSIWELCGALFYGGKLVIPTYAQTRDMGLFYELCLKERVTILNQTPTAFLQFSHIVDRQSQHALKIKTIILGGEALNNEQLFRWWQYADSKGLSTKLVNMYGLTEATVHVTYKKLNPYDKVNSNIGRPIEDLQAYILDRSLNIVPIGVVGELCVGGAGLARAYLNRPDLTAERFISNPFATGRDIEKGYTRLYKTGDLVRWLPDGNIEYIGRNDFQVKIRGFRVELGEVESNLLNYPSITQVVVIVRGRISDAGENHKFLVAYYISDKEIAGDALIEYLHQSLPDYMIPTSFVKMNFFPMTLNGKFDRKSLPTPTMQGDEENYVPPSTELEISLCHIWQTVLGLEKVGIKDNFFRVGGNSLLTVQLQYRINQVIRGGIKITDLFQYPTIASFTTYHPAFRRAEVKSKDYLDQERKNVTRRKQMRSLLKK